MAERKNEAVWRPKEKRWRISVQLGGSRKYFYSAIPGVKGKIEAEKAADKWLEEQSTGGHVRVSILLDKWYEELKASTSYGHYHQYDGYIKNYIKPVIGTKRISHVTKADLQSIINRAYQKKRLAEKTLKNLRGCIMGFLEYCRDCGATELYPGKLKIPAGAKPSQKTILAPEALKTLFSSDITTYHGKPIKDFYIHAYRFAVLTGMRPGELLGLRTRDIRGDIVTIRQSVNDNNEITRGKNKNARRTYQLGELALKELEAQRRMLMAAGKISEYVFPREETMDFINQAFFRSRWKRYCAANGITAALTPYELRHTFVSVNVEMPIGLKKMVMGHSENMDTEGVYGHQKKGDMELAAQYIDAAFKKIIG